MSGIPVQRMAQAEGIKLAGMKEDLQSKVIAQDTAIEKLVKAILRSRVGLKDPNKPIGTFMFLGPTGVGKTHLAKELALSGIALLYQGDGSKPLSTIGIVFVLLSSLSYTIYIVGVNRSALKNLPTTKLTFYAILFGLSVYIVRLNFCTELQVIPSAWLWADVLALAILPTAVSLVCTALAIHYIGSTPTAILGALEPVTALFFGVLLFHEKLTPRLMTGILMIITAVTLIIIGKSLIKKMGMLLQMNKK